MDLEDSVDKELLDELIQKTTEKKTKDLRSEIGQLKKLINDLKAKNYPRGPASGASTKKVAEGNEKRGQRRSNRSKSPPSRTPSTQQRRRGQKADAPGNATRSGSKSRRNNSKKKRK